MQVKEDDQPARGRDVPASDGQDLSRPATETAASNTHCWDWRQFSAVNRARCESPAGFNHALRSWSLSDWFTAVLGELGEAANIGKKLNRVRDGIPGNDETPETLRSELAKELADTFVYLDLLAQSAGVDLPAAVSEGFNAKSRKIGSPIRFDPDPIAVSQYMLAVLKDLEWIGMNDGRGVTRVACPACSVLKSRDGSHNPYCGLAAAIAKAEGR